jgi:hypothetical protein
MVSGLEIGVSGSEIGVAWGGLGWLWGGLKPSHTEVNVLRLKHLQRKNVVQCGWQPFRAAAGKTKGETLLY